MDQMQTAGLETSTPAWEDLVIRPEERVAPVETLQPQTVVQDSGAVIAPKTQSTQPESMPASYLTHELRAPVTAIRLGLEILSEQIESRLAPDERQMLSLAVKNTARLEGLVNDIMDFSKIMAGKLTADRVICDVRSLMRDSADCMRSVALAKGVKLVVDDSEVLPRIYAEPRRIVQILTNLISNGIKYTPARGTVTITAKLGEREHAGTILFKVKDTGRGIAAKDLEKIFDMFVMSSNTKAAEGTGLGLTMARLMVQLHGGRIWAESWREVGATFFFTIPIAKEDMRRPIEVYPKEVEVTGLLVSLAKRFNSFLALFV